MKKIVLLLAIALIAGGAVWAQFNFDAVPTISTEARHSAGRYDSDVDNFIDPAWHNPEIGTFMFAGGYPTVGATNVHPANPWAISFGFGKTLGESKNYLGIYYGGSLVDGTASGAKVDQPNPAKDTTDSDATWENNLAVLFGTAGMGIRFDLIMNNASSRETIDGKTSYKATEGATVALKWGTSTIENFVPWASVGFKFPDQEVITAEDPTKKPDKKVTVSENAELGLLFGGWYGINDTVSVVGELAFNANFGKSFRGDTKDALIQANAHAPVELAANSDPWRENGLWNANLYAHWQKKIGFGEYMSIKLLPYMRLNLTSDSHNTNINKNKDKFASDNTFILRTGFNVGGEYKYEKIGLYTAFGLQFFRWTVNSHSGGKVKNKNSDWTFTGISWNSFGNLGFGLTFTPIKGLVFGTGANFGFLFNPSSMRVTTGDLAGYAGTPNPILGTYGTQNPFAAAFDVTISYTF